MDILDIVTDIASHAAASDGPIERRLADARDALCARLEVEEHGATFRHREQAIRFGLTTVLETEAAALSRVAPLELASAPLLVVLLPLGDGAGISLTRYARCPGERLARADATEAPFGDAAAERFRQDMRLLADQGLLHPYAARGRVHWWLSSETGTVVLDAWSALRPCDSEEAARSLARIDRLLRERA